MKCFFVCCLAIYNTETVFEMTIDILLLNFMVRGCRCWHISISGFIGVIRIIKVICFCISFELLE